MERKNNNYAIASFVLSLLFWVPVLNIFTAVLAIVFGITSLKILKEEKGQKGEWMAISGITIGAVTILLFIIGLIIYYLFPELIP